MLTISATEKSRSSKKSLIPFNNKLASNKIDYEDVELDNLRTSAGLLVEWYSPFGPLQFDVATPLNKKPGDKSQLFDFAFGTSI